MRGLTAPPANFKQPRKVGVIVKESAGAGHARRCGQEESARSSPIAAVRRIIKLLPSVRSVHVVALQFPCSSDTKGFG